MASKFEEINPPRVKDFVRATDNGYSPEQIVKMEQDILKSFNFRVRPMTFSYWLDEWISKWDLYTKEQLKSNLYLQAFESSKVPIYKSPEETSCYFRYREITQVLDLATFDISIYEFSSQIVAAALLYLQAGFSLGVFDKQQIFSCKEESQLETILLEYYPNFSDYFVKFSHEEMNVYFDNLVPAILYFVKFYAKPLSKKMPIAT